MKEGQKLWTRRELLLAINLYCKIPFGRLHKGNPAIIQLAGLIGRTPSSVALKLVNFASLDPTLLKRGIKGATNSSKLDKEIWNEFYGNWDALLLESELKLAEINNTSVEALNEVEDAPPVLVGKEKEKWIKTRVNQAIFRRLVMATYESKCCITGINNQELLIASHILPWSKSEQNRLNPMNGLALNALHDRAFEVGLITIDANSYQIKVSSELKNSIPNASVEQNFLSYEGKEMLLPTRFLPDSKFLKIHNAERFRA